jgi:hypothetical protein
MKAVELFSNIGEHARMRVLYVLCASLGSVGLGLAEALESDRREKVVGSGASVEHDARQGCRPGSCECPVIGSETSVERKSAEGEEK